jgi:hypothetical protein
VLGALEPKVLGEELLVQYAPMLAPRSMLRHLCFALIILRCGSISSDDETSTLTFEVCGGLTNQRMALVHGFMIAHITNRSVLLPWLNPNGVQTGKSYHEDRSNLVPFSKFFDVALVTAALAPLVRVAGLRPEPPPANLDSKWVVERKLRKKEWYRSLADRTNGMPLEFDCTFLALDSRGDQHLLELYWKMDDALHFAPRIVDAADRIVSGLQSRSLSQGGDGSFSALHLRIEEDWITHCRLWENYQAPNIRDNCLTNTDNLHNVFAIEGVSPKRPLYVAGELRGRDLNTTRGLVTLALPDQESGRKAFDLVSKDMVVSELLSEHSYSAERDVLAAIDYAVCARARVFVGNSVSTFSAHLILERLYRRRAYAQVMMTSGVGSSQSTTADQNRPTEGFHYNGGDIPLDQVIFGKQEVGMAIGDFVGPDKESWSEADAIRVSRNPAVESTSNNGRSLKWVFAVNGDTPKYDEMTRIAVLSALHNTTLVPVCIFYGQRNHLADWLTAHGVNILYHNNPTWQGALANAMGRASGHQSRSPLYQMLGSMIATFLRIDIPILGFVDDFVLYTDVDVLFVGDLFLNDFVPLPKYYTVGSEANGPYVATNVYLPSATWLRAEPADSERLPPRDYRSIGYGNAGIMLMNVAWMRRTQSEFVSWTFSDTNAMRGVHYGPFGPGDQGAYNQFYAGKFVVHRWPLFNWKPYWGFNADAKLIHFHGPKPADYIACVVSATIVTRTTCCLTPSVLSLSISRQPRFRESGEVQHAALNGLLRRCNARANDDVPGAAGCFKYTKLYLRWRHVLERMAHPDE